MKNSDKIEDLLYALVVMNTIREVVKKHFFSVPATKRGPGGGEGG